MVRLVKAVRGKDAGEQAVQEQKDKPSAVGTKLSEVTIRKLIIIVLCCIIILPILDGSLDGAQNLHHIYGLAELHRIPQDRNVSGSISQDVFAERVRQRSDVGSIHAEFFKSLPGPLTMPFHACTADELIPFPPGLYHSQIAPECPTTTCKATWSTSMVNSWLKETTFQEINSPFSPYDQTTSPVAVSGEFWRPESDIIESEEDIYNIWRVAEVSQITLSGCFNEFGPEETDLS